MIKLPFSLANVNRDTREMEGTALVNITFVFCISTIYNINRERWPSWVEYRSGGTGGPHTRVDIFADLSPRARPYCGVK